MLAANVHITTCGQQLTTPQVMKISDHPADNETERERAAQRELCQNRPPDQINAAAASVF